MQDKVQTQATGWFLQFFLVVVVLVCGYAHARMCEGAHACVFVCGGLTQRNGRNETG